MMIGAHAYFEGSSNIRLHYRAWDVPTPRAVVIVSHGLGEHSGRYQTLATDFARAGLSTFALDHRGHGRSDGRRGHVRRFAHYIRDLDRFRRRVVGAVGPDAPLFFLGHSMGGLILIRYLQEFPGIGASGVVLSAPLLGIAVEAPRWRTQLGRLLTHVIPALPVSTGLDPKYLSHDAEIVVAYERDPMVHDRITPRLFSEINTAIAEAQSKIRRLAAPTLMLVPSRDQIVRPDLVQRFAMELAKFRDVSVKTYPDLYHEALNETTRSRVVADVLGWIEQKVGPPALGVDSRSN